MSISLRHKMEQAGLCSLDLRHLFLQINLWTRLDRPPQIGIDLGNIVNLCRTAQWTPFLTLLRDWDCTQLISFFIFKLCLFIFVWCVGSYTNYWSWFYHVVPEIKLRLSDLVASAFTSWPLLLAPNQFFYKTYFLKSSDKISNPLAV